MAFKFPYNVDRFTLYEGDERTTDLSLAIQLIDDFTDKEPLGHIRVKIKDEKKKAVRNLSKYYIFTGLENRKYTVVIESDLYLPEEITIDASKIKFLSKKKLEFSAAGPAAKMNHTTLKDALELEGIVVEFRNPAGDIEQRSIISTSKDNKIYWKKPLKNNFNVVGSSIHAQDYILEIILQPAPSYSFPNHITLVSGLISNSDKYPVDDALVKVKGMEVQGRGIITRSDKGGEFLLYFKEIKTGQIEISIEKNGVQKSEPVKITLTDREKIFVGDIAFP